MTTKIFFIFFAYYFLKLHLHNFPKIKSHNEVTKQKELRFFLLFLLAYRRSRIRIRTYTNGSGSTRSKNIRILRIWIRNTEFSTTHFLNFKKILIENVWYLQKMLTCPKQFFIIFGSFPNFLKSLSMNLGEFAVLNTHSEFLKTIFPVILALSGTLNWIYTVGMLK